MALTVFIDVVVVVWILYRQLQVRRVRSQLNVRVPAILGVIGLVELISYTDSHHVSAKIVGILALSMVVGAGGLGAIRAATVHIWQDGDRVLRQGTWLTMGLWVFSLALHFGAEWWIDAWKGPSGLASASLLLYLGITYGVQSAVVHRRAQGMLAAGPAGGRSAPFAGHWWGNTWTPPSRGPAAHPGAIDASSEPLSTPPPPAWPPPPPPPSSSSPSPPWPPPPPPPPAGRPPDDR